MGLVVGAQVLAMSMCSIRDVAHLITAISFKLSPPSSLVSSHHGLTCYLTQHTALPWAIHPHATAAHPRKDAASDPNLLAELCDVLPAVL